MCLNPLRVVVPDLIRGRKVVDVPCGHCLQCLKRKQDDITIRIIEESKNWPRLVFFTLTYSPEALHTMHVDVDDYCSEYECGEPDPDTGDIPVDVYCDLLPDSKAFLEKTQGDFGIVFAKDFSDTMKRFREKHIAQQAKALGIARKDVPRLNLKYFATTEYGPTTLRPHMHGIVWFDFGKHKIKRLFADWSKRFGYVNYTIIDTPSIRPVDVQKIARYVGKYCSKGVFESPLVKDGVAPSCTRLYSKGIGASYVDKKRSWHCLEDVFPDLATFRAHMSLPLNRPSRYGGYKSFLRYVDYVVKNSAGYAQCFGFPKALDFSLPADVASLLASRYHYTLMVNGRAIPMHLPRYYKNKIYGEKSFISCSLSAALAESFRQDCIRKFESYRNAHPKATDYEILVALDRQDRFQTEQKVRQWYERTLKHYKKSKV